MKITVVAAIGIAIAGLLAILLIHNLQKQQNPNAQTGPETSSFE